SSGPPPLGAGASGDQAGAQRRGLSRVWRQAPRIVLLVGSVTVLGYSWQRCLRGFMTFCDLQGFSWPSSRPSDWRGRRRRGVVFCTESDISEPNEKGVAHQRVLSSEA